MTTSDLVHHLQSLPLDLPVVLVTDEWHAVITSIEETMYTPHDNNDQPTAPMQIIALRTDYTGLWPTPDGLPSAQK
jgi:hypothetical protein